MSGSNIIPLGGVTKLPIDPDLVLEGAKGKLDIAILVGRCRETGKLWIASSEPATDTIGFWLDLAKHRNLMPAIAEIIP